MEYKIGIYYIITKGSDKKNVMVGDTIFIESNDPKFKSSLGEYCVLITPKEHKCETPFDCRCFKDKEELDIFMQGIELKYDEEYVKELLVEKQKEIDDIKMLYDIPSGMNILKNSCYGKFGYQPVDKLDTSNPPKQNVIDKIKDTVLKGLEKNDPIQYIEP